MSVLLFFLGVICGIVSLVTGMFALLSNSPMLWALFLAFAVLATLCAKAVVG